jgi:hypothetical protein
MKADRTGLPSRDCQPVNACRELYEAVRPMAVVTWRMPPSRRLPPPWKAEKIAGGYVIRDANGQAIAPERTAP